MPRVAPAALIGGPEPEGSAEVAARIDRARVTALARPPGSLNGRLTGRTLRDACALDRGGQRHVVHLAELERASGRGTERILRVARTIADLDGSARVREPHLDEAAWYRPADMRLAAAEAS